MTSSICRCTGSAPARPATCSWRSHPLLPPVLAAAVGPAESRPTALLLLPPQERASTAPSALRYSKRSTTAPPAAPRQMRTTSSRCAASVSYVRARLQTTLNLLLGLRFNLVSGLAISSQFRAWLAPSDPTEYGAFEILCAPNCLSWLFNMPPPLVVTPGSSTAPFGARRWTRRTWLRTRATRAGQRSSWPLTAAAAAATPRMPAAASPVPPRRCHWPSHWQSAF